MMEDVIITKYIVITAFGAGNLGDDLILKAAIHKYGMSNILYCIGFSKPDIVEEINFVHNKTFFAYPLDYLDDITDIVIAGGNIWSVNRVNDLVNLIKDIKQHKNNIRITIDSVGLNEDSNANTDFSNEYLTAIKELFLLVHQSSVRDSISYLILTNFGIKTSLTDDLVIEMKSLFTQNLKEKSVKNNLKVGINISLYTINTDVNIKKTLSQIISTFSKDSQFFIIPQVIHNQIAEDNDCINTQNLLDELEITNYTILPPVEHTEDIISYYNDMSVVITSRLHGVILSYVTNTKFITFSSNNKIVTYLTDRNMCTTNFVPETIVSYINQVN